MIARYRPMRRCTCRPGCLASVADGDSVTDTGALTDHAAYVATVTDPSPAAMTSPLRRLHAGGVPRRL